MQTRFVAVIVLIVIVAIGIAVALNWYSTPGGTAVSSIEVDEVCSVVSYYHSFPYNPLNNSSYTYTNTTDISTLETYTQTEVAQASQSITTMTGTTLTASGYPGIYWNETVCTFTITTNP